MKKDQGSSDGAPPSSWKGWDAEEVQQQFGRAVRVLRESNGWAQTELARRLTDAGLRMNGSQVAKIELGQRPTAVPELLILARTLGLSSSRMLLDELESTPREKRLAASQAQAKGLTALINRTHAQTEELTRKLDDLRNNISLWQRQLDAVRDEIAELEAEGVGTDGPAA